MMVWLPTVSVDVMNVACPLSSSEAVPTVVAPSLKLTVPVGVPPLPLTVTAKLTGWPYVLGFGVEDDVMLAAAGATFWVSVVPLLAHSCSAPKGQQHKLGVGDEEIRAAALARDACNYLAACGSAFTFATPCDHRCIMSIKNHRLQRYISI